MRKVHTYTLPLLLCVLAIAPSSLAAPYDEVVQPFLSTYCTDCHNEEKKKGKLSLTNYKSAADITDGFRQWEHVITFVQKAEMPPEKSDQPSPEERKAFLHAIENILLPAAEKMAGDPGIVLPQRLTSAEYNNTIRDLTGVDIQPADQFPVDPAGGEGFDNTAEALMMSPALFRKFYAAAELVADHALLTTKGIEFASHPVVTYADRKKHFEQAIIQFYKRHSVDYKRYLTSAWNYRHTRPREDQSSVRDWAIQNNLSPSYFESLYQLLESSDIESEFYVQDLRQRWNLLRSKRANGKPAIDPTALNRLVAFCHSLGKFLCPKETQAIVASAGNGPIQHIHRRRKTAHERNQFNTALVSSTQRVSVQINDLKRLADSTITIEWSARPLLKTSSEQGDGPVFFNEIVFSPQPPERFNPNDKNSVVNFVQFLKDHAPDQLARLGIESPSEKANEDRSRIQLAPPAKLQVEIPINDLYLAFEKKHNRLFLHTTASIDPTNGLDSRLSVSSPEMDSSASAYLVRPSGPIADQFQQSCELICQTFPNRFYYVNDTRGLSAGFHLIEGLFRDDQPLVNSVLSQQQKEELDGLWTELRFATDIWEKMLRGFVFFERSERNFMKHASFDAIKEEDPNLTHPESLLSFEQIYLKRSNVDVSKAELRALIEKGKAPEHLPELADHPIHYFFQQIREGLKNHAALIAAASPIYRADLQTFNARAYRQPLDDQQVRALNQFYSETLSEGESNSAAEENTERAVRSSLTRILVSPHFCYRTTQPKEATPVQPLSSFELGARLSYFLWASTPDNELLQLAKAQELNEEKLLLQQTRRMLRSPKVNGFVHEFFGQWLRYREFSTEESIDRQTFKQFDDELKMAMLEEPTRLITYLIQENLPITRLLNGNETFVNGRLARHYGFRPTQDNQEWERATDIHPHGRAGLLGMGVFLASNSQPQRTSPVKRGFWIVHHLLGEHIPPPPDDVVALPAKETGTTGQTVRQLLARHVDDPKCARCHQRFDHFGLVLEGFDAIGRTRTKDLAGRPIDNKVQLPNGATVTGAPEFAEFLISHRTDDFIDTLCRKFLGYALGRSVQLSDLPLLKQMMKKLREDEYRFATLFETVVTSPQFREQRVQ